MKKDIFDLKILENADDEVIEELNSFPSADEETKRRVFSMSEKKFNDLNNNFEVSDDNSVKGVERYNRPKWYRTVCVAAAALVLVGGGTATFAALHNSKKSNESLQAASEVETTLTLQETDDETATTQLSEMEMKCIYEKLFLPYMEIRKGSDTDRDDPNQEYVTFCYYFCDAAEYGNSVFEAEDFPYELIEKDGKMYAAVKFYKINNPKFHTIAEMKEVMGQYVNENFFEESKSYLEGPGISEFDFDKYEDGDVIGDFGSLGEIIQYKDSLYTTMYEPDSFDPENCEITYEKAFPINGTSFIWECYYHLNDDPENIEIVNALIKFGEDYTWKLSDVQLAQCSYETYKDFNGAETPHILSDYYIEALNANNEEISAEADEISTEDIPTVSETDTENIIEEIEPVTADPAKTVKDYSEEELMDISDTLVNKLLEFDTIPSSPYTNFNEMVMFRVPMAPEAEDQTPMGMGFGSLNDPRFSNLDELIEYYSSYIDESVILRSVDNRNDLHEGDVVEDDDVHISIPNVLEYQNKLYVAPLTWYDSVLKMKIKEINENDFVVTVTTSDSGENHNNMDVTISKTDSDIFKITDKKIS